MPAASKDEIVHSTANQRLWRPALARLISAHGRLCIRGGWWETERFGDWWAWFWLLMLAGRNSRVREEARPLLGEAGGDIFWGVSWCGAGWLSSLPELTLSPAGYIHQWSMQDKQEDIIKRTCCRWGSSRAAWHLAAHWASIPTIPSLSEPSSSSRESKCWHFALRVSAGIFLGQFSMKDDHIYGKIPW